MSETDANDNPSRLGRIFYRIFITLVVFAAFGGGGVLLYRSFFTNSTAAENTNVIFDTVKRGHFVHEVTSRGNVESAQNEDIRCQVESPSGTLIVWIIPEGTVVKKGEVLCRLDSSNLQDKVAQQKITVANNFATFQQSQADHETAILALKEYQEGTFLQSKKEIENRILKAQEDLSRAAETRGYTEKLLTEGYVTELQLKADKAKEEQTQNDLDIAKLELNVLEKYTKAKMEMQLKAAITTAKTKMDSDEQQWDIAKTRMEYYELQLENCTIKAPKDGQVVYATPTTPWRRDSDIIKEGNSVRERQVLIRLPDPRQMQVSGMVNEASVSHVKAGQSATITLEAMPNRVFHGTVKLVNDYPEPDGMMGSMTREYKTVVTIDDLDALPPEQRSAIRPGLTAQLRINVTRLGDETNPLLIPVQALFEYQGTFYCITYENGKWDKIPVEVGDTNDTEVVIKSGIEEGRRIVQGAKSYADKVLSEEEVKNAKEFGIGGARSGRGGGRNEGGNRASEGRPPVNGTPPTGNIQRNPSNGTPPFGNESTQRNPPNGTPPFGNENTQRNPPNGTPPFGNENTQRNPPRNEN